MVDLHSLILGWYDDRNLFHRIGYLVASRRATFSGLVTAARGTTKTQFRTWLDQQIRDSLKLSARDLAALTYQSTKTSRVLLLMNSETVRRNTNSSERYSFDAHAKRLWSLEHIHAQHSQGLNTVEQWTAWLTEHRGALDALSLPAEKLTEIKGRIQDSQHSRTFALVRAEGLPMTVRKLARGRNPPVPSPNASRSGLSPPGSTLGGCQAHGDYLTVLGVLESATHCR